MKISLKSAKRRNSLNMEKRNYSTKDIEDLAIKYVVGYLESKGEEAKIVKKGIDIISGKKLIEVKGMYEKGH